MNYFANDGTNLPSQHHRIEPVLRKIGHGLVMISIDIVVLWSRTPTAGVKNRTVNGPVYVLLLVMI